ncbi:MAG: hypothetical protein HQ483_05020 [Rhodospirillales bacterium]|nr:hypothetical protein [Rhodospirillales bacterium]
MNQSSTPMAVLFICRSGFRRTVFGGALSALLCLSHTARTSEAEKGCREAYADHANTIFACNVVIASPSVPIPQLIRALEIRAQALLSTGKPELALVDYTHAIGYLPAGKLQGYILYLRGKTYLIHLADQLPNALADLQRANRQAPGNTRILEALATAYGKAGQTVDAIRIASEAIASDRRSVTALQIRAESYEKRGQIRQALDDLDALLAESPHDPDLMIWRGRIHQRRNNLYAALADYRNAARLRSDADLLARIQRLEQQIGK